MDQTQPTGHASTSGRQMKHDCSNDDTNNSNG